MVSPTHFAWVKMTAAEMRRLKPRKGFEGQDLYFYHNHPIQFVCLAGIVVARDEYPQRTILVLDDSSGSAMEVVVLKSKGSLGPEGSTASRTTQTAAATNQSSANTMKNTTSPVAECSHLSATAKSPLDISMLVPGAIVKVKGSVSSFRSSLQLLLERFTILPDTNAEMRFWDERARYLADVLSVPWSLPPEEVAQLRLEADKGAERAIRDKRRAEEKRERAIKREERDHAKLQRRWEREEKMREKEAALCKEANLKFMRIKRGNG
jgi:hypothetical protein